MSDQPYVNLLDPEFYVDPWDAYRSLRDNDPVFWDPVQKLWGISRFEDVMHVEKHAQLYTSYHGSRPHIDQTENTSMIDQDDPAHQCQRSLICDDSLRARSPPRRTRCVRWRPRDRRPVARAGRATRWRRLRRGCPRS